MSPTARSIIVSALLLGVAACATSPAPRTQIDIDTPRYLRGLESEYVLRLDSLPAEQSLPRDSVMRQALISGDADVYVTAAVFRSDENLCMDLIVLNHDDTPIELGRADLKLVDGDGRFLDAIEDFTGADELGLRSRRKRGTKDLPAVAPPEWSTSTPSSGVGPIDGSDHKVQRAPLPRAMPNSASLNDWGQLSTRSEAGAPNVPERIRVGAEEGRAYWAYWQAGGELHYPLTAFVTIGDRHVMFQFEAP
jgi:hypothetical protein